MMKINQPCQHRMTTTVKPRQAFKEKRRTRTLINERQGSYINALRHFASFPVCTSRVSNGAQGHTHVHLCKFQKVVQETSVNGGGKRHKGKIKRKNIQTEQNEPDTRDERRQKQIGPNTKKKWSYNIRRK